MNRRSVAGAILVVWVGALSWLGWRQLGAAADTGPDELARTIPPGAAYYVVSVGETPIGYASHTVDTVPEGLQVDDRLILELPHTTGISRTDRRTLANLTNRMRLRDFRTTVSSDLNRYSIRGVVADDSTINLELEGDAPGSTIRSSITEAAVLTSFLPLRLAFRNQLTVGDTITVDHFEPASFSESPTRFRVAAESTLVFPDSAAWDSLGNRWMPARWDTLTAWQLEQTAPEPGLSMWVGSLGQIISSDYHNGYTVQRTAFEIAFHNFRARPDSGSALVRSGGVFGTAIAAGIERLDDPRSEFRIHIEEGWDLRELLVDDRQSFLGDSLLILASPVDVVDPTLRIPIAGSPELVPFMRPDGLTRSGDPRIRAQARLAVEGTNRADRAARRLNRWVFENIEKRGDVGVPNALQVLDTRAGDSYEHAILFVGLARAVGLPARTVGGLLYVGGRFYYHNWAEVHVGRGWLAVDPTFGQQPADASHVRLTYGGRPSDIEMVRLIGNLRVHVVGDGEQEIR